jgi:SAM-dependent methyltransferase
MTRFEWMYLCSEAFMPALYRKVRRSLKAITRGSHYRLQILDVGGRKSHYTIGIGADITITDLPRESDVQHYLNLGINQKIIDGMSRRRSNVTRSIIDDMTKSRLPDCSFDCVTAIEVLEHVVEDRLFVRHVHRILKPGGYFLMTTPNGEHIKNTNPDHIRHYTRAELRECLASCFPSVEITYAVRTGRLRLWGNRSWSLTRPLDTGLSMVANLLNAIQSAPKALREQPHGTNHLFAVARKPE